MIHLDAVLSNAMSKEFKERIFGFKPGTVFDGGLRPGRG